MLDKLDKKKNPFTVPEGYFENLTKEVMSKLPAKETQVKKVVLWKKGLPWASIAALVAIVAFSINVLQKPVASQSMAEDQQENARTIASKDLAYSEIEDYFLFLEDESVEAEYIDTLFDE